MADLEQLARQVEALTLELSRTQGVVDLMRDGFHRESHQYIGHASDRTSPTLYFVTYPADPEEDLLPPHIKVDIADMAGGLRLTWSPDGGNEHEVLNTGQAPGSISWMTEQTPTGTIDAANDTFTIARAPTICLLYKNHTFQRPGGNDYTLAGTTITYETHAIPKDAQYAGDTDDWHHAVLIG